MVKRTLLQPSDGPFKVLAKKLKFSQLQISLQKKRMSIDGLKPAHILRDPIAESEPFRLSLVSSTTTNSGRSIFVFRFLVADWRGESCGGLERAYPSIGIKVK
ncbi:hypothetical protein AVEN_68327-1 [Araneus ventricosus]|uniref:Uncharacterized protein n=1 Tax=Araneus ventricosus TaxID=182803 RepID=A0A4Y2GH02_ARAVE|nr:hypothetical protein AVEN_68327-1 [Araneus ventricosus]